MSSVKDAIRSASRLSRMRLGQAAFEYVEIPSIQVSVDDSPLKVPLRLAQVPLTEAEAQVGLMRAAMLVDDNGNEIPDNPAGMMMRNRASQQSDAWLSLRDPQDLKQMAFESIDEMVALLEPGDIDVIVDNLTVLMDYSSPSLDHMTEKDLEDLKKVFLAVDWSGLSGRPWAAVKLSCQLLGLISLRDSLSGSTSTESSMETRSDDEPT